MSSERFASNSTESASDITTSNEVSPGNCSADTESTSRWTQHPAPAVQLAEHEWGTEKNISIQNFLIPDDKAAKGNQWSISLWNQFESFELLIIHEVTRPRLAGWVLVISWCCAGLWQEDDLKFSVSVKGPTVRSQGCCCWPGRCCLPSQASPAPDMSAMSDDVVQW